jgi:hypothetical protein
MTLPLSSLERTLLELVAKEHWPKFRVSEVTVTRREPTGVGCYVYLRDMAEQVLPNGIYALGTHFIEMDGIRNGLFFSFLVANERIHYLELVTVGDDAWDGVERTWRIA